jgi:hypothetical protein
MDEVVSNKGKKYNRGFAQKSEQVAAAAYAYAEEHQPVTARQLFYALVVQGILDKNEDEASKLRALLVKRRRAGDFPWDWIIDGSRNARRAALWGSMQEMIDYRLRHSRLDPWKDKGETVVVLLEKDALAGVIEQVTDEYGVALYPLRGYSSVTMLHELAEELAGDVTIYQMGDFDPSGLDAARVAERDIREWAECADIHFERIAITPDQIAQMDLDRLALAERQTKRSDSRAGRFFEQYGEGAMSIELDAIPPDELRSVLRDAIERHLTRDELDAVAATQERQASAIRRKLGKA